MTAQSKKGSTQGEDDIALISQELEAVKDEANRLKDLAARAQADLQNAKVRMEKEGAEIRAFALAGLLVKLLPTVDNFQRAFDHLPKELQGNEWVGGLLAVEQGLITDLQSVGLQKMECLGKLVDPNIHEILQTGEGEKDMILKVFEEGYLLNDRVLRPAKVKVGSGS
ncbi:MAG: nucleotide exchange factor GrpE [bacterium]|nr:nucleotide exchange factor GrpE [bacterium]